MGWGVPEDNASAHMGFNLAATKGDGFAGKSWGSLVGPDIAQRAINLSEGRGRDRASQAKGSDRPWFSTSPPST
jgi:hypothetical protein